MQADMIDSIRIVTLDGECHEVGPGDDLFDYSLAACSPLGVISAVTLRTLAAPWTLQARVLSWPSMEAFLEDHYQLCQTSSYDMLRLRLKWAEPELSVAGVVGFFSEDAVDDTVLANRLSARLGRWESIDLYEHLSLKPTKRWRPYCPALEFLLPLPSGLAVLKELRQRIVSAGLEPYLIDGSMVLPMRSRSTLPLAPFPDSQETLMVAIRPEVSASQLEGFLPVMNDLGTFLLQNRATLYLMSIPIDQPGWVKMQFGEKFGRLVELKRRYDPEGLIKSGPGTLLVDLQEAL
jgi:hypothetical protein